MSTKDEEVNEGGLEGPSEVVEEGDEAIHKIVQHIAAIALGQNGELTPEAEFQIGLLSAEDRPDLLKGLIDSVCPENVNPVPWKSWLSGGKSPFGDGKLVKTGTEAEKPNLTMSRGTKRVNAQERKLEAMREELEREERRLYYFKAIEKAALHWHVTDQLLSLIAPVFAMGPAWTVMRALSGRAPDKHVEDMTALLEGRGKEKEAAKVRSDYAKETADILAALDFFSGIEDFELRLRAAVKEVVEEFEERKDEVVTDGRRKRSYDRMMNSVNPEAVDGADEVLDAFG